MQAALRRETAWAMPAAGTMPRTAPRTSPSAASRREHQEEVMRRQRRATKQAHRLHIVAFLTFTACLAFLGLLLFATLCARVTIAQNGAKMQTLDKQMADEKLKQSKLQVEVAELFSPGRVEKLASHNLGMVIPLTVRSIATEEYRLARLPSTQADTQGQIGQVTEAQPN